jgi:hypothetical protein
VLPTKFLFIWLSSFREDLEKSTSQKQELPMETMFVHLAKQFQRRRFLEIDQSEKKIAYGGNVC